MKNIAIAALAFISISAVHAQEPSFPGPQKEHEWLKQFNGKWTSTSKTVATDDQPSMNYSGTMDSQMLGGFWTINKMTGDMGGKKFQGLQTIGYDTKRKKYVGTWVDSMMNHLWRYEGNVDASGKKLVLVAEGPSYMAKDKLTKYRDSYEFKSPDKIIATSEIVGEDGKWVTFMTAEMKRVKPKK